MEICVIAVVGAAHANASRWATPTTSPANLLDRTIQFRTLHNSLTIKVCPTALTVQLSGTRLKCGLAIETRVERALELRSNANITVIFRCPLPKV